MSFQYGDWLVRKQDKVEYIYLCPMPEESYIGVMSLFKKLNGGHLLWDMQTNEPVSEDSFSLFKDYFRVINGEEKETPQVKATP